MLTEQKSACDGMIDEKNKLIHDFQQVNKFQYHSIKFVCVNNFNVQFNSFLST